MGYVPFLNPDLTGILISTGSICSAVAVTIIAITLITLRKKQKTDEITEEGAFKVPGGLLFPVITLVVIIITLVLLYFGDDGEFAYLLTAGWFAVGLIIFGLKYIFGKK